MAGWVEKRGEKKWRLNVPGGTGPDGKRKIFRKNVEAKSKREAEKLLDLFSAEVLKGEYIEPSKLTFADFAERWLRDYAEPELEAKTTYRYKELLRSRILPAMGHLRLGEIKGAHLAEFYRNLKENGVRLDGKPGGLSDSTIHHHHRLLSSMLNKAVEWGFISASPTGRLKPPKVKKREAPFYNEDNTAALLRALAEAPLKYQVAILLTITTGLREGELAGLEWSDLDFENETVTVRRAAQYLPGKGNFTKDTKTETSKREVPVPSSVMALLKEYRKEWLRHRFKVGDLWKGSDRVFTTWDGKPGHTYAIGAWFSKFLKKHKLPHLPFHGLRHTAATLMIAEGVPLKNVSSLLGHAKASTTSDIYTHALKSVNKLAAEKMDRFISEKTEQA